MSSCLLLRSFSALALALAPLAPAAQEQDGPDALAKLVPTGTAIYVQATSIDGLEKAARRVVAAFDPATAETIDFDEMIAGGLGMPIDVSQIDHARPIA